MCFQLNHFRPPLYSWISNHQSFSLSESDLENLPKRCVTIYYYSIARCWPWRFRSRLEEKVLNLNLITQHTIKLKILCSKFFSDFPCNVNSRFSKWGGWDFRWKGIDFYTAPPCGEKLTLEIHRKPCNTTECTLTIVIIYLSVIIPSFFGFEGSRRATANATCAKFCYHFQVCIGDPY